MSALQELKVVDTRVDVRILGPFFWGWYRRHLDDMIVKRKVLIFSITIRVRDLYPLFVQLFGPEPANNNTEVIG